MTNRDPYSGDPSVAPGADHDDGVIDGHRADAPPVVRETIVRDQVERPVVHEPAYREVVSGPSPASTLRQMVWLLFGVLQALIVIRIVLLLLVANEGNAIVMLVLGATDPFVEPFRGMFQLDAVSGASGSVLDIAAIVALIAWTLLEALILGVLGLVDRRATVA